MDPSRSSEGPSEVRRPPTLLFRSSAPAFTFTCSVAHFIGSGNIPKTLRSGVWGFLFLFLFFIFISSPSVGHRLAVLPFLASHINRQADRATRVDELGTRNSLPGTEAYRKVLETRLSKSSFFAFALSPSPFVFARASNTFCLYVELSRLLRL